MEIRVNRSELLTELGLMQGIVERKSTIPVLSHLLLNARSDKLHLAATDLDVSLTSWCEADVDQEGGVAIQARKFLEIVRALPAEEVNLVLEDTKRLRIRAAHARFKIHGLAPEDFPSLPEASGADEVQIPFPSFREMIGKIIFAVSAEESRFQLNGALFKLKDGSIELVATDGHRLALVETTLESSSAADGVIVPRKALLELQRFESGDGLVYRRGEHHLSFRLGRRELICRILEGSFPDYERVITTDNDKEVRFETRALGDVVHRVALLTGDRARAVRMRFGPSQLVVSAANPDLGEAEEELECEYDGPEFHIGINPDYLGQFLGAVSSEKVRFDLKDENSQCIGYPLENGAGGEKRYLCVIMPMRI